ncbi:MAG: ACP S-malonyltransferase [Pseudomonadota bacterium]
MKTAWLFPGQGTQRRGMGAEVFDLYPGLIKKADGVLGYSIRELCLEDPDNKLGSTHYCQPAMFVVGALLFLQKCRNEPWPDFFVGHSLGEYNALFAAGVFDFEEGVSLVKRRGELMSEAGTGLMLAVIGPEVDSLMALILELNLPELDVANYNLPTQTVLSGPDKAIDKIAEAIEKRQLGRAVYLHVGGAFHSSYAESVAQKFDKTLDRYHFSDPVIPTLSNVTAKPYEAGTVRNLLGKQICSSVRWVEIMDYLHSQGVSHACQIGPGRVLDGLWERYQPDRNLTPISQQANQSSNQIATGI